MVKWICNIFLSYLVKWRGEHLSSKSQIKQFKSKHRALKVTARERHRRFFRGVSLFLTLPQLPEAVRRWVNEILQIFGSTLQPVEMLIKGVRDTFGKAKEKPLRIWYSWDLSVEWKVPPGLVVPEHWKAEKDHCLAGEGSPSTRRSEGLCLGEWRTRMFQKALAQPHQPVSFFPTRMPADYRSVMAGNT